VKNEIKELVSEIDWKEAFPILVQLRSDLRLDDFLIKREDLQRSGYMLFGLYSNNRLVCVTGACITPHIDKGKELWIHDMITNEKDRSKGYGKYMLKFIESFAQEKECSRVILYSRLHRTEAHNFYKNKALFEAYGLTFQKELF